MLNRSFVLHYHTNGKVTAAYSSTALGRTRSKLERSMQIMYTNQSVLRYVLHALGVKASQWLHQLTWVLQEPVTLEMLS